MKGMPSETDYVKLMLVIVFFLPTVQANYDESCENPETPSSPCGKGKFKDPNGECQICPDGQFQDALNHVCGQCKNCTKCGDGEISKDHPYLCLTYEDTTCIKINDTTTLESDGTSPATEGPLSNGGFGNYTTNSEETTESKMEKAEDASTPGSPFNQEKERVPYKIGFYVILVLFMLLVAYHFVKWLKKKLNLKNGHPLVPDRNQNDNQPRPNGSAVNQNDDQPCDETELSDMLTANGHV